jgi:hypothetical protein
MVIDNKNIIQDIEQRDIVYARKYWKDPQRKPSDFFNMLQTIEESSEIQLVRIKADTSNENDRQLLSAYRRLGKAMGYSFGEFKKDGEDSICQIQEGDINNTQVQQGQKDREYMKLFWTKYVSNKPELYFTSLKAGIEGDDSGLYQFIGIDADTKTLAEDSRAKLSTIRIMTRAFGQQVGNFKISEHSGTAVAKKI